MKEKLEERERRWIEKFKEQGHDPILMDEPEELEGEIDKFVLESGFHNGPGCKNCGWSTCWHCLEPEDIPKCKG